MNSGLQRVRGIADYQFGPGTGSVLFPEDVRFERSKSTGKIRFIFLRDQLLASLRPNDGVLTLTIAGAERVTSGQFRYSVTVMDDVSEVISQGKNVFSRHVVEAGDAIRPGDEVVVVDSGRKVLAVGKAMLNRGEMLSFKTGVAVRTRRGRKRDR
jgi:predicted RNA-binding protein (TIGR00451 family)